MLLPGSIATPFLPHNSQVLESWCSTRQPQRAGGNLSPDIQVPSRSSVHDSLATWGRWDYVLALLRPKGDFAASDQQVPTWLHESIADPSDTTCVAGTAAHASPGADCSPQPLTAHILSVSASPSDRDLASSRELQGLRCNHSPNLLSIYLVPGAEISTVPGLSYLILTTVP